MKSEQYGGHMLKISSVNPEEWKYPEPKYPLPKGFKYNAVLDMEHTTSNRYISKESIEIISKLFERGYWAYLYGECVLAYSRHCKNISKFTIVTNASLSELKSIYSIAEAFGENDEYYIREFGSQTTICVAESLDKFLSNQGFTMFAMAMYVEKYKEKNISIYVYDPYEYHYGNYAERRIKCTGNAEELFKKDPKEILVALIENVDSWTYMGKDVDQAIHSCVGTLDNIPQRMIHSFFYSMLNYPFFDRNESFGFAVGLAMYSDVFIKLIPELANVLPSSPADIPDKRTILCGALNPRLEKILRAENVFDEFPEFQTTIEEHWFEIIMTILFGGISLDERRIRSVLSRIGTDQQSVDLIMTLIHHWDGEYLTRGCKSFASELVRDVGPIKAQLVLAILLINLLDEVNTKEKVVESKEYRKLQMLYHYLFVEIIEY